LGHARSLGELGLRHAELEPAGSHGLAELVGALGRLVAGTDGFAVSAGPPFPSHMFTHHRSPCCRHSRRGHGRLHSPSER
jgi:hypothetical protein